MATVAARLGEAGFILPEAPDAVGDYVPARVAADIVFTSGQLPTAGGALLSSGLVGEAVSVETAIECARQAGLNALAAASTVCDLDRVARVLKVVGYVASADGFTAQPAVVNGASEVMIAAFGSDGRHAREAVGVRRLPMDAPVEVSVILLLA